MVKDGPTHCERLCGRGVIQFLAAFTASLNLVNSGLHFGWSSPTLPQLLRNDSHIPMTEHEASSIASTITYGVVIGAALTAVMLDSIGRKAVILLATIPFFVSWMLIAFARSYALLAVGRVFAGIGDGLSFCSISMYIGEISQPKYRGRLVSAASLSWIFGMFIMNIAGSYFAIRTNAICSSFISVAVLLMFSWMPESPYFLLMKKKTKEAARSLKLLKGKKDIEEDLLRIKNFIHEQYLSPGKYVKLFTVKSNRKAVLIVIGVRILQQCTGVTSIIFFAQIIFRESASGLPPKMSSVIYFAIFVTCTLVCFLIVDKTGRKPLFLVSVVGTGITLSVIACYFYIQNKTEVNISSFSLIPTIALLVHAAVYSVGLHAIPSILTSEMFAASIKPLAVCISHICFAGTITIVTQTFSHLKESYGVHVPFFMFTGFCVVALVFVIFAVPETKGKTLEQIQNELVNISQSNR